MRLIGIESSLLKIHKIFFLLKLTLNWVFLVGSLTNQRYQTVLYQTDIVRRIVSLKFQ
jgi:hypothetical protein